MKFTITLQKLQSNYAPSMSIEVVKTESFPTIKEARKAIREMIKEFSLIRHARHIVNYSTRLELFTNF